MAEICCDVANEACSRAACEPSSTVARRRRMEIRRFESVGGTSLAAASDSDIIKQKRRKVEDCPAHEWDDASENYLADESESELEAGDIISNGNRKMKPSPSHFKETLPSSLDPEILNEFPAYGVTSVCGRRREMEDAVAVHPSLYVQHRETSSGFHYFAVYDGHGCSHVAMRCRERLHELVREELSSIAETGGAVEWRDAMERSFRKMDGEVTSWKGESATGEGSCRCELQSPECDAVGSTAVVAILTHDKIIVANCGDSRAVLSRKGKPIPLSKDHKPDRPDELDRIQAAGGRVIYWNGPRVLGVLAMSRAIGDNYLKPYVSCEPEVTIMERTSGDECLILASDGLWDVVSNETACKVARMCLRSEKARAPAAEEAPTVPSRGSGCGEAVQLPGDYYGGCGGGMGDNACSDASMLLTKLALARHSTDNVSVVVVDLRTGGGAQRRLGKGGKMN